VCTRERGHLCPHAEAAQAAQGARARVRRAPFVNVCMGVCSSVCISCVNLLHEHLRADGLELPENLVHLLGRHVANNLNTCMVCMRARAHTGMPFLLRNGQTRCKQHSDVALKVTTLKVSKGETFEVLRGGDF
jgi:hypothetical protein